MIIGSKYNPKELIESIGNPLFMICDDTCDEIYRHKNHPKTLRIMDCEDGVSIDITGESLDDTRKIAEALLNILNQDYYVLGVE